MMGWMDVTVALLIIINVIKGWTRGFILTILHMMGFIVAWIIANTYYKVLSTYIIFNSSILSLLQDVIQKRLSTSPNEDEFGGGVVTDYNIYEGLKLPKAIEEFIKSDNVIMDYGTRAVEGIYQYLAETFARMFIDIASFFLIFLTVKFLLLIIAHVVDGIGKLPILKEFNRLGGGIVGGLKGLFIVFIILAIIIPFVTITNNKVIMEGIEKSKLTKYMYDHNPIIRIFESGATSENSDL